MPGHKGYRKGNYGFLKSVYPVDITELSFSDNLAAPTGIIKSAEDDIARLCSCNRAHILTGGSTLGVLAMVCAVKNRGKKLIISKSSHKSVYNALKLFNIEPVFLQEDLSCGLPSPNYLNANIVENCDNDVIGALLTSPDYFGRVSDLQYFASNLKKQGKLLLVDGAHGGHFARTFNNGYPAKYADIWVDGAHKTLNTLTQGALLLVNNEELEDEVENALNIFSTSSPNYIIMASVENGVKDLFELSEKRLNAFENNKKIIENSILDRGFSLLKCDDQFKITVDFCAKVNGIKAQEEFEKQNIFVELACDRFMLLMLSPYITKVQALKVAKAFKGLKLQMGSEHFGTLFIELERKLSYINAINAQSELIDLRECAGRICAENAGIFPPCYPVITAGEVFDNRVIDQLLHNKSTFGVFDKQVKVVKEF